MHHGPHLFKSALEVGLGIKDLVADKLAGCSDLGLVVDNFAGGGGASTGIEAALERAVDIAINHDDQALAMHLANHPDTIHISSNIRRVQPRELTRGRKISLAWFSPDCKDHSKAKGGRPRNKKIRDLAWVVMRWAFLPPEEKPDVIALENVEEFADWGPLRRGKRVKERRGETFAMWVQKLRDAGYVVQWKELRACDYGAPTIRKRFFLIARSDGKPIAWPEKTHGNPESDEVKLGILQPWRTAAECIDWSIPCPSIFTRRKELAEATKKRIAHGVVRFVLNRPRPYLVQFTHHGSDNRVYDTESPFQTVTGANRGEMGFVAPCFARTAHGEVDRNGKRRGRGDHGPEEPLPTITASRDSALVAPHITKFRTGSVGHAADDPMTTVTANSFVKRPGGAPPIGLVGAALVKHNFGDNPAQDVEVPLHAVTTQGNKFGLVEAAIAPVITYAQQGGRSRPADEPHHTIAASPKDQNCVIAASLIQTGYGERPGQEPRALDPEQPLGTAVAGGCKHAAVAAHLEKFSENSRGKSPDDPLDTVMAGATRHGVVATHMTKFASGNAPTGADEPLQTIEGHGKQAAVAAFMSQYRGSNKGSGGDLDEPAHTVTAGGQHQALVCAHIEQANTGMVGHHPEKPLSTIVGKGCTQRVIQTTIVPEDSLPPEMMERAVQTAAFLIKYYGAAAHGQPVDQPLHSTTGKARFAVVTVTIDAETYVLVDIGMRMLVPRELFNAQGFPADYDIEAAAENGGKPLTKTQQIEKCGNSVSPVVAEAIIRANFPRRAVEVPQAVAA